MRPVNPHLVIDKVAEWHWLKPHDLTNAGKSGNKPDVVAARRQAIRLIHDLSNRSWRTSISLLGGNDSGHGLRVKAQALTDEDLAEVRAFVLVAAEMGA